MSDSWEKRKKALENEYFQRKNAEALKRLQQREAEKPRLSPITGEPMEQLTLMGVVIDRCPTSHGIWLDAGELEQILDFTKEGAREGAEESNPFTTFFSTLFNTSDDDS